MQYRIGLVFTFLDCPFKLATVRKPKFKNIGDTWAIRPELQMIPIAYLISRNRLAVYFDNLPAPFPSIFSGRTFLIHKAQKNPVILINGETDPMACILSGEGFVKSIY